MSIFNHPRVELPTTLSLPRFEGPQALFISVAASPEEIYGQREEDGDHLVTLSTLLTTHTDTTAAVQDISVGLTCAVFSPADEALYRGIVEVVTEEGVTVRYPDYGNTEVVPATSIFTLHPSLYTVPVLAVHLKLVSGEVGFGKCVSNILTYKLISKFILIFTIYFCYLLYYF